MTKKEMQSVRGHSGAIISGGHPPEAFARLSNHCGPSQQNGIRLRLRSGLRLGDDRQADLRDSCIWETEPVLIRHQSRIMNPRLRFFGVAAYELIDHAGRRILVDPFLDDCPENPVKSDALEKVDLVVVSHAAWDHLGDTEKIARKHGCPVVCGG